VNYEIQALWSKARERKNSKILKARAEYNDYFAVKIQARKNFKSDWETTILQNWFNIWVMTSMKLKKIFF
jgi:hypothetical protein